MAYKITGRIISVGPTQELTARSGNSYQKRDFVMTVRKFDPYTGQPTDDESNTPKFSLFGDRCNDLNAIFKGDIVTVHFEINGRPYDKEGTTDYFTEVRPLRVEKVTGTPFGNRSGFASPELMTVDPIPPYGRKVSVADIMEANKNLAGYEGEAIPLEPIAQPPAPTQEADELPF